MEYSSAPRQEAAQPESDRNSGDLSLLKKLGFSLNLNYTGETFHGFRVLPDGATRYRGLLEIEACSSRGKTAMVKDSL
jgi:hypothetical protein